MEKIRICVRVSGGSNRGGWSWVLENNLGQGLWGCRWVKEMEIVLEKGSWSMHEVQKGLDLRYGARAGSLRGVRFVRSCV